MYDAIINGEYVSVNGKTAELFCEKYVQTVTEDGEDFFEPQDYTFRHDQSYELVLETELDNGLLVLFVC